MSAPTHSDQDLSRREELSISGAAMSGAPWGAAVVTGGVVAAGDLGLHIIGSGFSGLGLSSLSGSLAIGAVAFFVVAAAGALWRAKPSRAIRWARSNPWRFAVMPAIACAAIVLVLSVVTGGGVIDGALSGLWHGGAPRRGRHGGAGDGHFLAPGEVLVSLRRRGHPNPCPSSHHAIFTSYRVYAADYHGPARDPCAPRGIRTNRQQSLCWPQGDVPDRDQETPSRAGGHSQPPLSLRTG